MISAIPDARAFRCRFLLTCLLKGPLLLLVCTESSRAGAPHRASRSQDLEEVNASEGDCAVGGETGRGDRRSSDLGSVHLLIDSPSTNAACPRCIRFS